MGVDAIVAGVTDLLGASSAGAAAGGLSAADAIATYGADAAVSMGLASSADVAAAVGAGAIDTSTVAGVEQATAAEFGGSAGGTSAVMGQAAPSSLAQLLAGAKTAAPIIGGIGQVTGGIGSLLSANQMRGLATQADPFGPYRSQYASELANLMQNPNLVTTTPGYQFNLSEGLKALQASQASQGKIVSGGALLQAQNFGQQLAGQTYQQQLATLASLSGATQPPATGAGATANLLTGAYGGTLGGVQAIASGLGTATGTPVNPLYSLYSGYNQPSPTPTA